MGRPTKLTDDTIQKLETTIAAGNYYEAACRFAGISYTLFREWIKAGQEVRDGKRKRTQKNLKFLEFLEVMERAGAKAEIRMVANWQMHVPTNWQAARDFLERRYPERWGKKSRVESIEKYIDLSKLSDDQLERLSRGEDVIDVLTNPSSS